MYINALFIFLFKAGFHHRRNASVPINRMSLTRFWTGMLDSHIIIAANSYFVFQIPGTSWGNSTFLNGFPLLRSDPTKMLRGTFLSITNRGLATIQRY